MSKLIDIEIFDIDSTKLTEINFALILQLSSEQITIRDLISSRVQAEVARYNNGEKFTGLVQSCDTELRLNHQANNVSAEKQIDVALNAFKQNQFFLLIDDEQITDLDKVITLTRNTHVAFYRLTPVVGG